MTQGQPWLVSDSLNPAKARVLLMTALTQTRNPELIRVISVRINHAGLCAHPRRWAHKILTHGHKLFRCGRVNGDGIIEVFLGSAHLQRHCEALQHFIHAEADTVDTHNFSSGPTQTSFIRHGWRCVVTAVYIAVNDDL